MSQLEIIFTAQHTVDATAVIQVGIPIVACTTSATSRVGVIKNKHFKLNNHVIIELKQKLLVLVAKYTPFRSKRE